MFDRIRHKSRGERHDEPSSSSHRSHRSHRHHAQAPPSSHHHRQAYDEADFAFRPADSYDASQPVYADEAPVSGAAGHSQAIDDYAIFYNAMRTILDNASHTFVQDHAGICGLDANAVFATLVNSVLEDAGDSNSVASSCSDSSSLRVVVMTKSEYHSWQRLSVLNASPSAAAAAAAAPSAAAAAAAAAAGRGDLLRPMRHALSELALSTKRLEMRFGTEHMDIAIQQQHTLERLAIKSQYKPRKPASVMLVNLTDELSILAGRLKAVQEKAEAGTVPFCSHVLDLDRSSVLEAGHTRSSQFSVMDVAKGFTLLGLAGDALKTATSSSRSRSSGASDRELAKNTLYRCDDNIRRIFSSETTQSPSDMLDRWLAISSHTTFHHTQVILIKTLLEQARQARASRLCGCASASSSRGHASSSQGHGHSSRSSGRPPRVGDTPLRQGASAQVSLVCV